MRYTKAMRIADFYNRLEKLGFTRSEANILRRAEMTLQRWGERECGDGSNWAIERDEKTGKPFNVYHGDGKPSRYAIADREKGALRRVAAIVAQKPGLWFYHQGDPRGHTLYVGRDEDVAGHALDSVYNRGIACNY